MGGSPKEPGALDRAAKLIVSGVRDGRYAPGQRLIEADLVDELGISRSSVREALRRLEAQGLVEMIPHRGARVRRLTQDDTRELYEVRAAIESGAARLAARRIDVGKNRKRLIESFEALKAAAGDGELASYLDANSNFHDTIVELSGNKQLAGLIDVVRLRTVRLTLPAYFSRNAASTVALGLRDHAEIVERILEGDGDGAASAMLRHIDATSEIVIAAIASLQYK